MKKVAKNNQFGFTIVELLIATVVFSIVLVGAMAGFTQIGRLYYKGVVAAKTQEVNRAVIEEISQAIQFNKNTIRTTLPGGGSSLVAGGPDVPVGNTDTGYFCIGPKRYTYALDRKLSFNTSLTGKEKRHVMWVDQPINGCAESATGPANLNLTNPCSDGSCINGRELMGENMRLTKLVLAGTNTLQNISVSVAFGDDENNGPLVTESGRRICRGESFIVQFCAISELSTTAYRRVN
jgi:prepilin-type N-terminal cleavage/methylation domain-containing protein